MTVENLEINVRTNVTGSSAKTVTSLADALDKLQASAASLSGLSNLTALARAMTALSGTSIRASAFSGITKGIENLSASLKSITSADIARLSTIGNALKSLNGVNLGGLGNASNISRAANSLHQTARAVDDVARSAKKADGPLSNFISSLKRIAFYRIIRSIIKAITQAFKEGLENAYEYSKVVGGDLAPALDRIASASQQMKNQLGAALGELIVALEPFLVRLIELITELARGLTWLFAILNGKTTYTVADKTAVSWNKATKAAKEYKNTILGFDVINRLNDKNGGGGTNPEDYSDMFHEEPTGLPPGGGGTGDFWIFKLWDDLGPIVEKVKEFVGGSPYTVEIGVKVGEWLKTQLPKLRELVKELVKGNPYTIEFGFKIGKWARTKLQKVIELVKELVKGNPYRIDVEVNVPVELPLNKARKKIQELKTYAEKNKVEIKATPAKVNESVFNKIRSRVAEIKTYAKENKTEVHVTPSKSNDSVFDKIRKRVTEVKNYAKDNPTIVEMKESHSNVSVMNTVRQRINEIKKLSPVEVKVALNKASGFDSTYNNIWQQLQQLAKQSVIIPIGFKNDNNNNNNNGGGGGNSVSDTVETVIIDTTAVAAAAEAAKKKAASDRAVKDATTTIAVAGAAVAGAALIGAAINEGNKIGGTSGGSFGNMLLDHLFASGGFPEPGELFVARERGPELVGSINGRTAVANNDQIVEGIKAGVYDAVTAAMGGNTDRPVNVKVYLDSREIRSGQQRLARSTGY